jgi:hypothetical protein
MKPTASSFAMSFLIASLLFGVNRHSRCFFGVAFGLTFRQCSINYLSTPGISTGFHANMSRLALRKSISMLSYLSSTPAPIRAVLDGLPSCSWMVFRPTSLVLGFTVD